MSHFRFSKRKPTVKNSRAAAAADAIVQGVPPPIVTATAGPSGLAVVPLADVTAPRQPRGLDPMPKAIRLPIVLNAGGEKFTQDPRAQQSSAGRTGALVKLLGIPPRKDGSVAALPLDDQTRQFITAEGWDDDNDPAHVRTKKDPQRHRKRRAAQYATWRDTVIPSLIRPFLAREHGSIHLYPGFPAVCCCGRSRIASIILADIDGLSSARLEVCKCRPAAPQLVAQGYFPSAPMRPSVAFSLRLVELISIHSLNVAPNITAWATTLEAFWSRRGFTVQERRTFRTRLGNAVHWYQVLVNQKDTAVATAIDETRLSPPTTSKRKQTDDTRTPSPRKRRRAEAAEVENAPPTSPTVNAANADIAGDKEERPPAAAAQNEGPAAAQVPTRPSDFLRQRCPICFGGPRPDLKHTEAHVIVCIDGNFSQKRRKSENTDPAVAFAGSRFVDIADVDDMEREVASKRKTQRKRTKGTSARLADDVLDECNNSFIAAQEKVTKASKNYYADTGLMALLCRHDRVLFIVNLTSPGERQHYALVLLKMLFDALPHDWMVGILYDIACQLSCSIEKHDLLQGFGHRLTFGVSVFHAYGHQWACQIVFHPRKRAGFGLSDGEGCERFWSALRRLIPCMRVSGFHRRLFVIDRQIEYVDNQNLFKIGRWLGRKWRDASQRSEKSNGILSAITVPVSVLKAEWEAQVAAQLQPAPRQSKYAGDKEVERILLDVAHVEELEAEVRAARAKLKKTMAKLAPRESQAMRDKIHGLSQSLKSTRQAISLAKSKLGTGALRAFEDLRGDAYIRARVNARALRVNIRMSVRAHKFEREKLERDYRRQVMQHKDHAQTRDLVHRREKNLAAMVRKYNQLVDHMDMLLKSKKAPGRTTKAPRRLDAKKLFRLDVDDEIWQEDPGLGPQDEGSLPRWQVDEDVRKGIHTMLEAERCREELERLAAEVSALLAWWMEEREVLVRFCFHAGDELLVKEAQLRLKRLEEFAIDWNKELARGMARREMAELLFGDAAEEARLVFPVVRVGTPDLPAFSFSSASRPTSSEEDVEGFEGQAAEPGNSERDDTKKAHDVASEPEAPEDASDVESLTSGDGTDSTSAAALSPDEDEPDAPFLDTVMADVSSASDSDGESHAFPEAGASASAAPVTPLAASPTHTQRHRTSVVVRAQGSPRAAASHLAFSSSSEDNAPPTGSATRGAPSPPTASSSSLSSDDGRRRQELPRQAGEFWCEGDDIERMSRRTAWLSGSGLAVFAESHRINVGVPDVGHLASTLFIDVHAYTTAQTAGNFEVAAEKEDIIRRKLEKVPSPLTARKWLIMVHIVAPEHWILLEVRWQQRELRFYDSLSARGSYDTGVRSAAFTLLGLCERFFDCNLRLESWSWIGEQRRARQSNWYDCGPFAAADFVSLLTSDEPSPKTQKDMRHWRRTMLRHMRGLQQKVFVVRKKNRAAVVASPTKGSKGSEEGSSRKRVPFVIPAGAVQIVLADSDDEAL